MKSNLVGGGYKFIGGLAFLLLTLPLTASAGPALRRITKILCNIRDWFFTFALIIGVIFVIVAAFQYMTAAGDSEKVRKAHWSLTYAAIGLAVAILAAGVPQLIGSLLGEDPGDAC